MWIESHPCYLYSTRWAVQPLELMAGGRWVRDHVPQGEKWAGFLNSWDLTAASTGSGHDFKLLLFLIN